MARGRPTKYSEELAAEICSRLATGDSMRTVCLDSEMPSRASIFKWMAEYPEFSDQYAKAKEEAAEALAEELFDIADDGMNDWMEKRDAEGNCIGYAINGEAIARSKLRVDVRKWYLSKIKAKKYGDSSRSEQTINLNLKDASEEEIDRRLNELLKQS